ncbi:hypothetical protein [Streptomyces sp. NPDC052107]|uniref:hypothetical protein n=1 Tax=Streptomyces sp. NPDC052107 TaxID=3155632 RepID=UPI003430F2B6
MATGTADGTARIYNAQTGARSAELVHEGAVRSVVFSRGRAMLATASADKSTRVFDTQTGVELLRLLHDWGLWRSELLTE